jgi:2,5-diamino-6-(ribosylamino)-4(3H)-pyrimidinone 5'-phosphate reductase
MPSFPRRPRVICHMMASIDGRIVVGRWPELGEGRGEYERTAATYDADAWMCGRITMEPFAGSVRTDAEIARERAPRTVGDSARQDFVAANARRRYAVAVDPSGRLLWDANDIDGDHIVAVLSDRVSDDYLSHLRDRGVSYLFAANGADRDVNLALTLEKLAASFGVRTLLLEGGGQINGAMLRAGLIDEVSLLIAPVADGFADAASLFDIDGDGDAKVRAHRLTLDHLERRAEDVLWVRYRVESPVSR